MINLNPLKMSDFTYLKISYIVHLALTLLKKQYKIGSSFWIKDIIPDNYSPIIYDSGRTFLQYTIPYLGDFPMGQTELAQFSSDLQAKIKDVIAVFFSNICKPQSKEILYPLSVDWIFANDSVYIIRILYVDNDIAIEYDSKPKRWEEF